MIIDEKKAEYLALILTCVGLFLTLRGIDGPLIAGSILCGAILITRQLKEKTKRENQSDEKES